jgi:hypothetical protein
MSAFYDIADSMVARLVQDPALAGVPVVVDRQRDIASELRKAVGMNTGAGMLVITWTGGTNADEMSSSPRIAATYTVTGFFKPVLRPSDKPADDILEAVCKRLQDWTPAGGIHFHSRLVVKSIEPIQHPEFLAMRVKLACDVNL